MSSPNLEYKWVPFLYISYALCVAGLMFFMPLDEVLKMHVLLLMTLVYVGALSGLSVRALKRIEDRLAEL